MPRLVFLVGAARNDLQRVVRQRALQRLGFIPGRTQPHVALFIRVQDHRHGLRVNRLDDGIRGRRQEAIDQMRAGDRLRLRAAVALEFCADPGKRRQRPIVAEGKPDNILFLGRGVRFRRVFGEAIERHQAAAFRLQPAAPVRRRGVADVGNRRPAEFRRRRHAPAHQHHLAIVAGVADDRRRIIGKRAGHGREVADVAVAPAEQPADRFLVGGDRVEIAHG
jgi:hypothetical protein